jgi:glyoxylate/hydroxypyruvate reductase A
MAILYNSEFSDPKAWRKALMALDPTIDFRIWPDLGDHREIDCVLCWQLPRGVFAQLPNLRLVCATSAGTDRLQRDPERPRHVPLTRMTDPSQAKGMVTYVLGQVLQHHLRLPHYRAKQRERRWDPQPHRSVTDTRVGVMGLGYLGAAVASALSAAGFDVAGWSRASRAEINGVGRFVGEDEKGAFLGRTDILVCLLPLTDQTRNILDCSLFEQLPPGAAIISVGRGNHLVETDLIEALDRDHLRAATLDVFRKEPLPEEHPFWHHPKIEMTPHIATTANPATAAIRVVENLRRLKSGEPLLDLVEPDRGY